MPDKSKYNLDFRPDSYWEVPEAIYANIKGEIRRQVLQAAAIEGELHEMPHVVFADTIPEPLRVFTGSIHPANMGGEYLPDYRSSEVEVARASLQSVTWDVISIRARCGKGRIRYHIVDEYDRVFRFRPQTSSRPLTLRQLIGLIDGTRFEDDFVGLTDSFRNFNIAAAGGQNPEELIDFVTVSSEFYPQLQTWYEDQAQEWLKRSLAELQENEKEEEEEEDWDRE